MPQFPGGQILSLFVDLATVPYPYNENHQGRIFNFGDHTEMAYAVFPKFSEFRTTQRFPQRSWMLGMEHPFSKPALFTPLPTAAPSGPASEAFRSVARPHRSDGYASGALGRKTPQPHDLTAPRDGRVVNKSGVRPESCVSAKSVKVRPAKPKAWRR